VFVDVDRASANSAVCMSDPSTEPPARASSARLADFPFAARRLPFFYGWVVVFAATVAMLCSIPGQTIGVSVFTEPVLAATGLDRVGFSNAYLVGTVGSALLLPRAGALIDRIGVRFTAASAAVALALVVNGLANVDAIAATLATTLGIERVTAAFAALTVLFVGLRFSGQGVLMLASNTMLGRWFDRRRGIVAAISSTVVAFGFASAPPFLEAWVSASGWRGTWIQIGWIELVFAAGLILVLFRETPESCGLHVDGLPPGDDDGQERLDRVAVTRREAMRTGAFWALTLGLALQGLVLTGFSLHIVDLGAAAGLTDTQALAVFLPIAFVGTALGPGLGWLIDRVQVRSLMVSFGVCQAVGFAALAHLGSTPGFVLAAIGLGAAQGHFSVLSAVGYPRFFGRVHLGAVAGAGMAIVVGGTALGPSLLAWSRASTGSYAPALYLLATTPLLVSVLAVLRPHPNDRVRRG
jgi:OFA family oxalate/formate antiporter-like MFS transporter